MPEGDPGHLLVNIAKILRRLKIPYLITGGIAVLVWGRPRFTADIDIIVELKPEKASRLKEALLAISKYGYVDAGAIERALRTQGEFNFIDGETGIKVDFWILKTDDGFDQSRLRRRVAKKVLGETIYFTSPEDLILIKLLWHKESQSAKQLEDVESVFKISEKKLDKKYLKLWARRLRVLKILNKFL